MAKKVSKIVKLQVMAGKANPAPPVGPALGQAGVNIMGFCKEFNERTKAQAGLTIPVVITVFEDRALLDLMEVIELGSYTDEENSKAAACKSTGNR